MLAVIDKLVYRVLAQLRLSFLRLSLPELQRFYREQFAILNELIPCRGRHGYTAAVLVDCRGVLGESPIQALGDLLVPLLVLHCARAHSQMVSILVSLVVDELSPRRVRPQSHNALVIEAVVEPDFG